MQPEKSPRRKYERPPRPLTDIEKAILTQMARGRSTVDIAKAGIQSPDSIRFLSNSTVYNREIQICRQYDIWQRSTETSTSYAIRIVFAGLKKGDIDTDKVLEGVNQASLQTFYPQIESFFENLESGPAPSNHTERYELIRRENAVAEVLKHSEEFGIESVTHAAAVWKIMQMKAASEPSSDN